MRVLHVLNLGRVGGLITAMAGLAAAQRRAGDDVSVAAVLLPGEEGHPILADLRRAHVAVFPVAVGGRAYLRERREIARIVEVTDAEVVHTHGYRADVVDAPVGRRLGRATVTTVHGFTGGGLKNRFYERLQVRAYRRFHGVAAVSRKLAQELAADGVPRERLHVIPNAWVEGPPPLPRGEARRALGLPEEGAVVGWVGRVTPEKGADVFVEALAGLPDVTGSIIGDGRERARLEEAGGGGRIRWHGMLPDARKYMGAFDVFVLSSRTEGMPMVLFEVAAAGVPIVATAVGGVPDMLAEGEALLVQPERPDLLAEAIARLLADQGGGGALARAAASGLRARFGPEAWAENYRKVYESALSISRSGEG